MEATITAVGDVLKSIKPGILMILLGTGLALIGAFESLGPITVNPTMAKEIFYAGMTMAGMGAFFSWYKAKMDALKLPSLEVYTADKIEREAMLDQRFHGIEDRFDALSDQIVAILYEVKPNGGNSLKDSINRIDRMVDLNCSRDKVLIDSDMRPMFETDEHGGITFMNRAYLALLERGPDECSGNGWFTNIHQDDRGRVIKDWQAAVRDNRAFETDYRIVTPAGREVELSCRAQPIIGSKGDVIGRLGQLRVAEVALAH